MPPRRSPAAAEAPVRTVNKRGQGTGLRREILTAAAALLADASAGQAVTLRGIARRAGIAAPSIYPHFADRDAILAAVVAESFEDLAASMRAATDPEAPGAERVRTLCRAYLDFAARSPGRYRVLFERTGPNISADARSYPAGLAAFDLLSSALADAVAQGGASSTDPVGDSAALWTALHGLATLPAATPGFPWPPTSQLLDRLTTGLAHLATAAVDRCATPASDIVSTASTLCW